MFRRRKRSHQDFSAELQSHNRIRGGPAARLKTVQLDDQAVRIAGVLPRTFEMPQLGDADILVPEQLDETVLRRVQIGAFLRCFALLVEHAS
jgi:hypothetical protein